MFGSHSKSSALVLLKEAQRVVDGPGFKYAGARRLWGNDFNEGARWMHSALCRVRQEPALFPADARFNQAGFLKNGSAALIAALVFLLGAAAHSVPLMLVSPFVFYFIEVQMVFLFPLMLEGNPYPFRNSRALVVAGGGTLNAVSVVLPISLYMMVSGFLGQGFVRSWCVGCLAVVLWYEKARGGKQP